MIGISAGILLLPLMITIVIYFIFKHKHHQKENLFGCQTWLDLALFVYCTIAAARLFFPLEIYFDRVSPIELRYNLIPFKDVVRDLSAVLSENDVVHIFMNLAGNFLLFVPLAIYLANSFPDKKVQNLLILFLTGVGPELMQLVLIYITGNDSRVVDVDDCILNLAGSLSVYFAFRHWLCLVRRNAERHLTDESPLSQ